MIDLSIAASRRLESARERWERLPVIVTGEDYVRSINALRATYDLALDEPGLATAYSPLIDARVNRFLHITTSAEDLQAKHAMQRRLGQLTGTCFQRCTGLDAVSALHSVTYDVDREHGTRYHGRFLEFLEQAQRKNVLIAAGMTDPMGDRSKPPHGQADPDVFLHVSARNEHGLFLRGAKAH